MKSADASTPSVDSSEAICFLCDQAGADASNVKNSSLLLKCIIFCVIMMTIEFVGGVMSNSLAIQSDAVHMLVDVFTLLISYFSMRAMMWRSNSDFSFGWRRMDVIGSLASVLTTWALAAWIGLNAIQRIANILKCSRNTARAGCDELNAPIMLGLGCFGLLMNILLACVLYSRSVNFHSHSSLPTCESTMIQHGKAGYERGCVHGHSDGCGSCNDVVVVPVSCEVEDTSCSTMNITATSNSNSGGSKTYYPSAHRFVQVHPVPTMHASSQSRPRYVGGCCSRLVTGVCSGEDGRMAPAEEMDVYSHAVTHADPHSEFSHEESNTSPSCSTHHDQHTMTHPVSNASHCLRSRLHHSSNLCRNCTRPVSASHHSTACRNTSLHLMPDTHVTNETHIHPVGDVLPSFCSCSDHLHRTFNNDAVTRTENGNDDNAAHDHPGHSHDAHGHSHNSMNMRATLLHVFGDCLQAFGVVFASAVVWVGNRTSQHVSSSAHSYYNLADPFLSLLFGVLTIFTTLKLLSEVLHILMERVPRKINYSNVANTLLNMPMVCNIDDLHIWAINPGLLALCANIVVNDALTAPEAQKLCNAITAKCQSFGIHHSTIQISYRLDGTNIIS